MNKSVFGAKDIRSHKSWPNRSADRNWGEKSVPSVEIIPISPILEKSKQSMVYGVPIIIPGWLSDFFTFVCGSFIICRICASGNNLIAASYIFLIPAPRYFKRVPWQDGQNGVPACLSPHRKQISASSIFRSLTMLRGTAQLGQVGDQPQSAQTSIADSPRRPAKIKTDFSFSRLSFIALSISK